MSLSLVTVYNCQGQAAVFIISIQIKFCSPGLYWVFQFLSHLDLLAHFGTNYKRRVVSEVTLLGPEIEICDVTIYKIVKMAYFPISCVEGSGVIVVGGKFPLK